MSYGVGPKTAERLTQLGIHTLRDLAAWPEADLTQRFGKHGSDMARRAQGIDVRPVETERETKSVSKETTFTQDVDDREILRHELRRLSQGVGRRLRSLGLQGSTVKVKLRWSDFTTLTRQVTLTTPTDRDGAIYAAAQQLLEQNWSEGKPVRLLGVGVSGFATGTHQLSLWEPEAKPEVAPTPNLQTALAKLRDKFGEGVVQRGSEITPKSSRKR